MKMYYVPMLCMYNLYTSQNSAVDRIRNQISTLLTIRKDDIGRVYGYIKAIFVEYIGGRKCEVTGNSHPYALLLLVLFITPTQMLPAPTW